MLHAVHISKSPLAFTVDKSKEPKMQLNLNALSARQPVRHHNRNSGCTSVDRRIRAFLSGATHGGDMLHALYGKVADEPIPERLRAILKR